MSRERKDLVSTFWLAHCTALTTYEKLREANPYLERATKDEAQLQHLKRTLEQQQYDVLEAYFKEHNIVDRQSGRRPRIPCSGPDLHNVGTPAIREKEKWDRELWKKLKEKAHRIASAAELDADAETIAQLLEELKHCTLEELNE